MSTLYVLVLFVCVQLLGSRVGMSSGSSHATTAFAFNHLSAAAADIGRVVLLGDQTHEVRLNSNGQLLRPADTSSPVATGSHDDVLGASKPAAPAGGFRQIEDAGYSAAAVVVAGQAASAAANSNTPHINPSVVVIVVILSVVFILSGFLHLLARCLGSRSSSWVPQDQSLQLVSSHSPVSALHGQLQHLFHLHDAGVEQAFIDTLPVFSYGSIRGLKDSADCAVCLNEFGEDDRLRLLPKCKHAFHLECIDTWFLSNSTCPLCRRSLLPDPVGSAAPEVQAAGTSSSIASRGGGLCSRQIITGASSFADQSDLRAAAPGFPSRSSCRIREEDECEIQVELESPSHIVPTVRVTDSSGKPTILKVELGKVKMDSSRTRATAAHAGHSKRRNSPPRSVRRDGRSYSMGSYEYVVDPSNLELMIAPTPFPGRPQNWAPSKPSHRSALSDSIPELASASGTPANDDLFWASRGLYTPHTLSRVRELLSPSPGRNTVFSPATFFDYGFSPSGAHGLSSYDPRDHHQQPRHWTEINMGKIVAELEEEVLSEDYSSSHETQATTAYDSDAYLEAVHSGSWSLYLDQVEAPSGSLYFEADDESQSEGWSDPLPDQEEELDEALSAVASATAPDSRTHSLGQSFRARFQAAFRAQLLCATDQAHGPDKLHMSKPELVPKLAEHNEDHNNNNNNDLAKRSSSLSRLPEAKTSVSFYSRRRSLSETSALGMQVDLVSDCCNSQDQLQKKQQMWVDAAAVTQLITATHHDHQLDVRKLQLPGVSYGMPAAAPDHQSSAIITAHATASSKSKRYTLQWLMGRNSRVVCSAATPPQPASSSIAA